VHYGTKTLRQRNLNDYCKYLLRRVFLALGEGD